MRSALEHAHARARREAADASLLGAVGGGEGASERERPREGACAERR